MVKLLRSALGSAMYQCLNYMYIHRVDYFAAFKFWISRLIKCISVKREYFEGMKLCLYYVYVSFYSPTISKIILRTLYVHIIILFSKHIVYHTYILCSHYYSTKLLILPGNTTIPHCRPPNGISMKGHSTVTAIRHQPLELCIVIKVYCEDNTW